MFSAAENQQAKVLIDIKKIKEQINNKEMQLKDLIQEKKRLSVN
ncbi:hypothetical protein [Legionella tunisiensis]|nr:hypothetical protein [Legionella tunisiensis]